MVDQDLSVVVDDQKLEPARQHRLAVGEQHLPAERHDVAPLAGAWRGAEANALAPRALFGGRKDELGERAVPARPAPSFVAQRVRRPERGDGGGAPGWIGFVPRVDIAIGAPERRAFYLSTSRIEEGPRALWFMR